VNSNPEEENTKTANLVRRMAIADPDFSTYLDQFPVSINLPASSETEAQLALDTISILNELPGQAAQIARFKIASRTAAYDAGVMSVPILLATAFLLRTHLRIKIGSGGKWEVQIEHQPGDTKSVTELLKKVGTLISGN
jgi:hypothetical protein